MIRETIARIEKEIASNPTMEDVQKQELLDLLSQLKAEVVSLESSHSEDARSITGLTESSVREAIRQEKNPELLQHSLDGMRLSVRRFEVTHPTLIGIINNIGRTLWRIGI